MTQRDIHLQVDAFWVVLCADYFLKVYDVNFSDMVKNTLEVIINDFSVLGDYFDDCLENHSNASQICEEFNLVLN